MNVYEEPYITADAILDLFSVERQAGFDNGEIYRLLNTPIQSASYIGLAIAKLLNDKHLESYGYSNNVYKLGADALTFKKNGGYNGFFERNNIREEIENQNEELNRQQIQSIIETNKSVKLTNDSFKILNEEIIPNNNRIQRNIGYFTLGIAALSMVAISFSAYFSSKGVTSSDIKSLDTQLQNNTILLEKMQQSQKVIDSFFQKAVKDSFYAPLPHHK